MTRAWALRLVPAAGLAVLVVISAALRRAELGPPALWNDDAWVALISRHDWRDIWFTSLTSVGFRALIGAWISVFGDSTTAAQALPFAFGLTTIPATYLVARRLDLHRAAALFAAALVAASPLLVTYSTRVKQYTGDALLTLAITASVARVIESPVSTRRWWLFAAVSCVAIAFSGQLLLVTTPAAFLTAACAVRAWRDRWHTALPPLAVVGVFSIVWYHAVLVPAMSASLMRFWADHYILLDEGRAEAAESLLRGIRGLLAGTVGGATANVAGAGVLVAAALACRITVAAPLLLPVLAAVAAAASGRSPIGARPDAYMAPLIALVMGAGLDALLQPRQKALARLPGRARHALVALCVAALIVGVPLRVVPVRYPPGDVRSLTRIWEAHRAGHDHTFVNRGAVHAFALYSREKLVTRKAGRRLRRASVDNPRISMLDWRLRVEPTTYFDVVRAAVDDRTDRVWILATPTRRGDVPVLKEAVTALGFVLENRWSTDGRAELVLYHRLSAR